VDSHFANALSYSLTVAEVSCLRHAQPCHNAYFVERIAHCFEPFDNSMDSSNSIIDKSYSLGYRMASCDALQLQCIPIAEAGANRERGG